MRRIVMRVYTHSLFYSLSAYAFTLSLSFPLVLFNYDLSVASFPFII